MSRMSDKQTLTVELTTGQTDYLKAMVTEFALPDEGKAIRCLINFARTEPKQAESIFGQVRCIEC
jgi:hypothetical protein